MHNCSIANVNLEASQAHSLHSVFAGIATNRRGYTLILPVYRIPVDQINQISYG